MLNEIREDLRTECEKFGQVKKVIIFDVSICCLAVKPVGIKYANC